MSSCLTLSIFVFYWNFLQHLHFLLSIVNVYIFVFAFSLAILTTFKFFFSIYYWLMSIFFKIQFSSVTHLCLTLCDPMDSSTPGLPVHRQLLEFTQTHVHWVSDAIQPSPPLSSPSPPTINLSQHRGLFQWVSSSHQVAKVLEFQLQHQSFQWIFRTNFL